MARLFPRYFVARNNASAGHRAVDALSSIHAVDRFFVGGRHASEREWVVTVDQAGDLNLFPGEDKGMFSNDVQSELAYSEMVADSGRVIDVSEFFLFSVQLLEQPGDAPGLNDPVYLYGTLYGPFPQAHAAQQQPSGLQGQLTVTRADLLDGLLQAREYPFAISPEGEVGMRNFHIALAGDREEEIDRGVGVVLAYPLLPADVMQDNPSNEMVIGQMLYDVLSSLKDDMEKEKVSNPLRTAILPVPNRMLVEEQLKQRGYTVEGDTAVIKPSGIGVQGFLASKIGNIIKDRIEPQPQGRSVDNIDLAEAAIKSAVEGDPSAVKTTVSQGFQGFLASAFGGIMKDRLEIPPQGRLDDYLKLAETALTSFKGWPPKRISALHNRIATASADVRMRAARYGSSSPTTQPPLVRVPAASVQSAPAPSPAGNPTAPQAARSTAGAQPGVHKHVHNASSSDAPVETWVKDFVDSHQKPGAPPARFTTSGPPPCTPKTPASKIKAEWLNDFDASVAHIAHGPTHPPPGKPVSQPPLQRSRDQPVQQKVSEDVSRKPAPKKEKKDPPAQSQPDWMKDFE